MSGKSSVETSQSFGTYFLVFILNFIQFVFLFLCMSMRDFMLKLHCKQDLNYLLNKEVRARDDIVGPLEPGGKGGDCPKSRILAEQLTYLNQGSG